MEGGPRGAAEEQGGARGPPAARARAQERRRRQGGRRRAQQTRVMRDSPSRHYGRGGGAPHAAAGEAREGLRAPHGRRRRHGRARRCCASRGQSVYRDGRGLSGALTKWMIAKKKYECPFEERVGGVGEGWKNQRRPFQLLVSKRVEPSSSRHAPFKASQTFLSNALPNQKSKIWILFPPSTLYSHTSLARQHSTLYNPSPAVVN
jgi:hypothetical protein